jgi:hypothetical protein
MAPPADQEPPADVPCSACRGTRRVISNLGGSPHEVVCPWCDGSGRRLPAHNAQERGGVDRGDGGGDGGGDDSGGGGGPDLAA